MNYEVLISGLIFVISLVSEIRACHTGTQNGISVANCSNLNHHEIPKLPNDVQVVDFSKNPNLILKRSFLSEYSSTLIRLNLSENRYVAYTKFGDRPQDLSLYAFSELNNLQEFDFSASELSNEHQWILPSGLKKYWINDNMYSMLDLSSCKQLEELNVNNNYLNALPKFSHIYPPLTVLRANNNPFDSLTVLDLAPLCYLSRLELQFPKYAYLAKTEGFCNCTLIKYWSIEFKIAGVDNLNCFQATEAQKKSCSNETLKKARQRRKECPLITKTKVAARINHVLKIVFVITLSLLLLLLLLLYIIRHFHLREMFAAHHVQIVSAAEKVEEEGEQSLQEQKSLDESIADNG